MTLDEMLSEIPDEVLSLYEKLTFDLIEAGITRYSSDAVLHRIRWHEHVEKGNQDFRVNNYWSSALARWFMSKHHKQGFFELRKCQFDEA